jgi:putative DNA primase/helicase
VLQTVAGLVLVRTADCASQPAWVEGWPDLKSCSAAPPAASQFDSRWPVHEILPTRNALVHLPSLIAGTASTAVPTPQFFNSFALDYEFSPTAPQPVEWLAFLAQIWRDDEQSAQCLQEWFGYLLTPDTRQQKILMMVGPKRSGRGTIARVLKALAGANNVVNPTLSTLARQFGLSALIDKPVAIFPDARLSSRPDNASIVECLLSISGEDDQTIDRKHLPAWTGRLPTRFVLISNELPRLRDASGALASRLIILRFTRSFYDREDLGLFDRLIRELPGILLWAVAGWERLQRRGRFVQPRFGRDLLAAMQDLGSPISAFLRERCILEAGASVAVAVLYDAWRSWCQEHGREVGGDEPSLGRDLHAAIPGLAKSRFREGGTRVAHYRGIRLRPPLDVDPDPLAGASPGDR